MGNGDLASSHRIFHVYSIPYLLLTKCNIYYLNGLCCPKDVKNVIPKQGDYSLVDTYLRPQKFLT